MKKITFVLFALIAGTTFAQTTVNSTAKIIEAITLTEPSPLNFGILDNTAGTVIISPTNDYSGKIQIPGGVASAGSLKITGEAGEAYNITLPTTTITLSDGVSSTLNLTNITSDASGNLETGEETFGIGGTLTVPGGQTAGTYSGDFTVTVSYN